MVYGAKYGEENITAPEKLKKSDQSDDEETIASDDEVIKEIYQEVPKKKALPKKRKYKNDWNQNVVLNPNDEILTVQTINISKSENSTKKKGFDKSILKGTSHSLVIGAKINGHHTSFNSNATDSEMLKQKD